MRKTAIFSSKSRPAGNRMVRPVVARRALFRGYTSAANGQPTKRSRQLATAAPARKFASRKCSRCCCCTNLRLPLCKPARPAALHVRAWPLQCTFFALTFTTSSHAATHCDLHLIRRHHQLATIKIVCQPQLLLHPAKTINRHHQNEYEQSSPTRTDTRFFPIAPTRTIDSTYYQNPSPI